MLSVYLVLKLKFFFKKGNKIVSLVLLPSTYITTSTYINSYPFLHSNVPHHVIVFSQRAQPSISEAWRQ